MPLKLINSYNLEKFQPASLKRMKQCFFLVYDIDPKFRVRQVFQGIKLSNVLKKGIIIIYFVSVSRIQCPVFLFIINLPCLFRIYSSVEKKQKNNQKNKTNSA